MDIVAGSQKQAAAGRNCAPEQAPKAQEIAVCIPNAREGLSVSLNQYGLHGCFLT
jgi:hypothetical protein